MNPTKLLSRIAVLYQAKLPPIKDGIQKPLKPGGYSDSGADIAFQLKKLNISVVTPISNPSLKNDFDWVFPDDVDGIQAALDKGADTLWLNTVLYKGHPVESFFGKNLQFVGQLPSETDLYDDKWVTNNLLRENGLSVLPTTLISNDLKYDDQDIHYPCVIKPLRGRGSQGVVLVQKQKELSAKLEELFSCGKYGNALYCEKYLAGQEITFTIMPPGRYILNGKLKEMDHPWSLPAVKRFNHIDGIAPYTGVVAAVENSCVLEGGERETTEVIEVCRECEKAASLVNAKAPIRIDCRADENGKYWIFDLNMKPNMNGASRPHRQDQNSLSLLAAKKMGWSYGDLLLNMLGQRW